MNYNTLRNRFKMGKTWYKEHFGSLNWQWYDEGMPNTLLDYHGSVGSVMDFTPDDWLACFENDLTLNEVLWLCNEKWLDCDDLSDAIFEWTNQWKSDNCVDIPDSELPEGSVLNFVSDWFTWRNRILPNIPNEPEVHTKAVAW